LPTPVFISGDLALVHNGAADDLHVEVPHVEPAAGRLSHDANASRIKWRSVYFVPRPSSVCRTPLVRVGALKQV
jgi:hypothetical protein